MAYSPYWNQKNETLPREDLQRLQLQDDRGPGCRELDDRRATDMRPDQLPGRLDLTTAYHLRQVSTWRR